VATRLRKEFGIDVAQVVLGHKTLDVTQVYAEKNVASAQKVMLKVG
jgi:integrase